jgi:hypothetical protein
LINPPLMLDKALRIAFTYLHAQTHVQRPAIRIRIVPWPQGRYRQCNAAFVIIYE